MQSYQGFEQGPIRPPSEAASLLLRVTRNCPWNRCTFCSVYKKQKFSLRPVADVIADIDSIHRFATQLQEGCHSWDLTAENLSPSEWPALVAARNWLAEGMKSIFLQDADTLVIRPENLVSILQHIKMRFPQVERITSYARSDSVARISPRNLEEIAAAGLNRIHIGMETASDNILKMISKGVSKETHVTAGLKAKTAGIELSEYVLTGIGGSEFSREHAIETADALNRIDPDFIRFRTLHLMDSVNLFAGTPDIRYQWSTDLVQAEEILLLIERLEKINSSVKSDHSYNLFQEIDGKLPDDKQLLADILRTFIGMAPEDRAIFQVGKRSGHFVQLSDMEIPVRRKQVEELCRQSGITPENVDDQLHRMVQERMRRGIPF
ncbi:MAG: radical SAM protein [Desulfuromonadaceae bacterium]|nr:radical SAM protein [Desulfuromonadaceae bacterium]